MLVIKKVIFGYLLVWIFFCFYLFGSAGASTFDVYFIHLSTGTNWLNSSYGGLRNAVNNTTTLEGHVFQMYDSSTGNCDHRDWPDRFKKNDWKNYDIVMFKSCFPASNIDSKKMLREYKKVYRQMTY